MTPPPASATATRPADVPLGQRPRRPALKAVPPPSEPDYRVKLFPRTDARSLRVLLPIYVVLAVAYLSWRLLMINWHVWYGPVVYVAEAYGALMTVLFLTITRRIYVPRHRPPSRPAEVDVLIPTYNEPLEVLRPTVLGALRVKGVSQVFVLDDGDRAEVRLMAERLGCRYVSRKSNVHAKAGNMNSGLANSTAEFVITLDADHVPVPQFLQRLLGYFDDPDLAFVQTPQSFSNRDTFLFRRRRNGRLWSEQGMFYDVIQPAKNRWNSAFFVGTSAVVRRRALDSVGGFATGTATEDIHTSLRLHAKGWKSLFVPEPLAFGLEAENLKEFYRQRMRWAAGSLGLLFRSPDSPLRARGLSVGQRMNYLSATLAHLQGVQRLVYFLLPIACIFQLESPVSAKVGAFLPVFVLFIAVSLVFTSRYARGTYHPIFTESYNLVNAAAHLGGLRGIIRIQRRFSVSKKRAARADATWTKTALWTLVVLSFVAFVRAVVLLASHDWNHLGFGAGVAAASVPFLLINAVHLLSFVGCLRMYERGHPERPPVLGLGPAFRSALERLPGRRRLVCSLGPVPPSPGITPSGIQG